MGVSYLRNREHLASFYTVYVVGSFMLLCIEKTGLGADDDDDVE